MPTEPRSARREEADLDPVIHAPARLRIMVALSAAGAENTLTFARLRDLLGLTAGNLITHVRRLEQEGYVASERRRGQSAVTCYRLTAAGGAALHRYREQLDALLGDAGR